MALPNPAMDFTPFDILLAEELDQLVENIESLSDGTGLENASVTAAKRIGGYKVGTFASPGSTGSYSVTGLGFKPKLVRFSVCKTANETSRAMTSFGAMDETGVQFTQSAIATSTQYHSRVSTGRCLIGYSTPGGNLSGELVGEYVSMDTDGFTVNISTANSTYNISWEAFS